MLTKALNQIEAFPKPLIGSEIIETAAIIPPSLNFPCFECVNSHVFSNNGRKILCMLRNPRISSFECKDFREERK